MITILPEEDRQAEEKILQSLGIEDDGARLIAMKDKGEQLGFAAIRLSGAKLKLLRLCTGDYDFSQPPDMGQAFVLDSLVRSAASYAENFGADVLEAEFADFHGFLKARGFEEEEEDRKKMSIPVSSIVRYG